MEDSYFELLPNDILKIIFDYFEDIYYLRIINKSFRRYIDKIIKREGIILPITEVMIQQYVNKQPDNIRYLLINKICQVLIQRNLYKYICNDKVAYGCLVFGDSLYSIDLLNFLNQKNIYLFLHDNNIIIDMNNFLFLPSFDMIEYYLNKHKFVIDNKLFKELSLKRTFKWYISKIKKIPEISSDFENKIIQTYSDSYKMK